MCMEDIRIGRESGTGIKTVTCPAATITRLCPADPSRTRLILSGDGVTNVTVGPADMSLSAVSGFAITPSSGTLVIRLEDYGSLVRQSWSAIPQGADLIVTVADVGLQKV